MVIYRLSLATHPLTLSQGAKTDIITYVDTSWYKLTTYPVSIFDPSTCILARYSKDKQLRKPSEDRLNSKTVKGQNTKMYADTLDRIREFLDTEIDKVKWHKTCYAAFTNVTFIARLKKSF